MTLSSLPSPETELAELGRQAAGGSEAVRERLEVLLAQAAELERRDWQISALLSLGCCHYLAKQMHPARQHYSAAVALAQAAGDEFAGANARALNGLGLVAVALGRYREADRFYRQSLQLARKQNDFAGIARALNNAALMWSRLGQPERALDDLAQSQDLSLRFQHPVHTFVVALNLIWVLIELQEYARAASVCSIYLSLAEEHQLPERQMDILCALAACQGQLGRRAEAEHSIQEAQTRMAQHPEHAQDATNHVMLALACLGLHNDEKAGEFLRQAVTYAEACDNVDMLATAHFRLARLEHRLGHDQTAYEHSWAYFAVREKMFPIALPSEAED